MAYHTKPFSFCSSFSTTDRSRSTPRRFPSSTTGRTWCAEKRREEPTPLLCVVVCGAAYSYKHAKYPYSSPYSSLYSSGAHRRPYHLPLRLPRWVWTCTWNPHHSILYTLYTHFIPPYCRLYCRICAPIYPLYKPNTPLNTPYTPLTHPPSIHPTVLIGTRIRIITPDEYLFYESGLGPPRRHHQSPAPRVALRNEECEGLLSPWPCFCG